MWGPREDHSIELMVPPWQENVQNIPGWDTRFLLHFIVGCCCVLDHWLGESDSLGYHGYNILGVVYLPCRSPNQWYEDIEKPQPMYEVQSLMFISRSLLRIIPWVIYQKRKRKGKGSHEPISYPRTDANFFCWFKCLKLHANHGFGAVVKATLGLE